MNDINLIPSFGARVRYYIAGAPFRVAGGVLSLALLLGVGFATGPSISTFINGGFTNLQTAEASEPQPISENRDRVTASWVALIEERALARENVSELDVTILTGDDALLIDEYQNAITRADVLVENGTRDENALMSATAEIRSSVAALEYAVQIVECETTVVAEDAARSATCLAE
jgi:hypothetical protein